MSLINTILTQLTTKTVSFFVGNVKGLENLKFNGPRIIIANHSSYMDHFVILYLLKKQNPNQAVYFLTKKEAFEKPFSRWWHLSLNSISVDRTKNAMSSMMVLKDKLITEKAVVVIYPEGTRTPTGNMYFGKNGAESLSYVTGVEMIPIGMHENFDVLPKFSIFPNFKKISVAVGNSIQIPKTSRKEIPAISRSNIQLLSSLAREKLESKSVESIDVKEEMLQAMIDDNQKALRSYPDANHTPLDYHKRVLYLGKTLLARFDSSSSEQNLIFLEIARAYGRLGYLKGIKTLKGRYYMMKTTSALNKASSIAEKSSEWYYIKGHQSLFLGDKKSYLKNLVKANDMVRNNIQYMLALAKAMNLNHEFCSARNILLSILKVDTCTQLDDRRKYEAVVLLMRMDSHFDPSQELVRNEKIIV
ncbi:1-acyl-sn-glycerol-3-phosphate acyltransferase [Leuconostoc citreum]|uniref:Phospholipid/glycerol acyltransferase domain-containing protein n=1 Tax=Leuconostoc citreum TaxID=33964 RepID=A0A5A5U526_LEUCI|nr:lysophospholipid acyltransferase family protein [Leuconostoc citreum]MCT3067058.1 1-acyl-sn-glycerol-3-phosphate acyltransferase [Leuconostoc citreum]TDG65675.1 hypothetical protein C5L21_000878 [Leuconostoc citreum]GDZ84774.1 hypothetical protein LCIT_20160 [Leuconostoc citreum]GDZ85692.1 hypothetical protein LCTS_08910 [Leuconostoc citreum]